MGKSDPTVRLALDYSKINSLVTDTTGLSCARAAKKASQRAKANAPKDKLKLTKSIAARKVRGGLVTMYQVGAYTFYAGWQERGTGPIYPVRAKFLRFTPKGSNRVVFAKRTRGVPASRYMKRAIDSVTLADYMP
jgi:hypothetical protein